MLTTSKTNNSNNSNDDLTNFFNQKNDTSNDVVLKFKEGEQVYAYEDRYVNNWCSAVIQKVNENDEYDVQFQDDQCWESQKDVNVTRLRKIPKGSSANQMKGEGVWHYESMSEEENDEWESEEDQDDDDQKQNRKSRSKKKIIFCTILGTKNVVKNVSIQCKSLYGNDA